MRESRFLGNTDIQISPIIMGTWQAGKSMWVGIDDAETTKAMKVAFDSGLTTFDTAAIYGKGHSEQIVGQALKNVRAQVVIATKVFCDKLQYQQVLSQCERSLKNLDTAYIDLYQIHWPSGTFGTPIVPIEETMRAMVELKKQGKIRAIGVSNFSRQQMEEAAQYGPIESLQPPYSLFWRHVENDALPYCQEHHLSILAYSPLAQGILTGKFKAIPQFPKGDHRSENRLFQPEHFKRVQRALTELERIADAKSITLGQLALAWIIAQPQNCAIAGARNAEQVLQNAKACEVDLTQEELAEMNIIGSRVTEHLDDNPILWA
ncbi:aldo/keto reductase [Deltaproteobacteria bacterium TL4]